MAFIYVITNLINGTQYVGKTTEPSIEDRWKRHVWDTNRRETEKRPLYDAFKKYGFENFKIEQLEECSVEILSERESYWIDKLDTYKNGYNATRGGDGSLLYDYKELANKYKELQSIRETAYFFNCDEDTVKRACINQKVRLLTFQEVNKIKNSKPVACYKNNKKLYEFNSIAEAASKILELNLSSAKQKNIEICIGRVANGQRKSAYGFNWIYI